MDITLLRTGQLFTNVTIAGNYNATKTSNMYGHSITAAFNAYVTAPVGTDENSLHRAMAIAIIEADKTRPDGKRKYPLATVELNMPRALVRANGWDYHFRKKLGIVPCGAKAMLDEKRIKSPSGSAGSKRQKKQLLPLETEQERDVFLSRVEHEITIEGKQNIINSLDQERTSLKYYIQAIRRIERDPVLAARVKEKAGYKCNHCHIGGFEKKSGGLYAEAHHFEELGKGGKDVLDNMICVCPTCHKVLHFGTSNAVLKRSKSAV